MHKRITLHWRFLLITSVALLATLSVVHFWHGRQLRKQSGAYLNQADQARDTKDEPREIAYLERYLRAQPQSNETRERLARLYAKKARTRKRIDDAFFLLEDCLRRDPDQDDLRQFAVEFAMDPRTSLVLEAFDHLQYLIAKYPTNAEFLERMGTYLVAKLDYQGAKGQFQKAYELQPDRLNAFAGHALIERDRLNNPEQADRIIRQMIERNQTNFRAHLYAFEYGRKYRVSPFIKTEIEAARILAPDELDVILAYADWCRDEARRLQPSDAAAASTRLAAARAELRRGSLLAQANRQPDAPPPPQAVALLLMQAAIEAEADSPAVAAKILAEASLRFPGDVAILTSLVDYQIRAADLAGAEATLVSLDQLDLAPGRLAYDRARLTFARREWLQAARELRRILEDQPSDPAFVRSIYYLLGRCYEQIGETDRRLAAFTQAIPTDVNDPLWVLAQLGQAGAYAALGRSGDALRTYSKLTDRFAGAWLAVARLSILQAIRTADPSSILWGPAEAAVQNCELALPDNTEAKLIKAELLVFQKRESDARAIIDPLFENRKQEPAVWIAKAFSVSRESNAAAGIALLERGRRELGDLVELRLAQAQLLVQVKDGKPDSQLLALGEDVEKYTPADRRRLLHGLAETAMGSGFLELSGAIWDRVVQLNPDDLSAQLIRFDRAYRSDDESRLVQIRNEIARIDGTAGVSTRIADAFLLIWKERRTTDRVGLDTAMSLLDRLERDRPGWSRITLGKALIFDRQGNDTAALAHYRKAVDQGESQPDVLRRLINLLAARGLFDEANAVLARLTNDELGGPDAMRLAADVSLRADNPKRALELAAKAVPPDSKNHDDFLWKGRLLWSAADREGSRAAFRQAITLNPRDPAAWLLLIETLTFDKRMDEAESVFRDAQGQVRDEVALLFTAQAHKLMGRMPEAREAFRRAREKRPDDVNVLRAEADFLMLDLATIDEAGTAWKRVADLGSASRDEKEFAKNMLAICLGLSPDYATARTAVTTLGLDQTGLNSTESSISKRTLAVVLSLQPDRASKRRAIQLFENERTNLTDNDRFLLAQWYFQVNDEPSGRLVMTTLLSRPPANRNSLYLSFYAGWLLAQRDPREAEPWVAKLEKIEPNALRTIELKVQMLAGLRNYTAARSIVAEQSEKPNAKIRLLAIIAEGAGLDHEAESLYKRFMVSERSKTPDLDLLLAGFYARRGRLNDALAICEKAWETCQPHLVGKLCTEALSVTPQVDPATLKRVADWIVKALSKNPAFSLELQRQLAFVRNLQGQFDPRQYDEALRIYDELSKSREPDVTVLNNLAYLLSAHKGRHDEALLHISRAKAKAGPVPDLLDTEALILMARGMPEDLLMARNRLKEALEVAPNAALYFHLAQLEAKAGNRDASLVAWRDAQRLKLKTSELHPLEKPAYEKMARAN